MEKCEQMWHWQFAFSTGLQAQVTSAFFKIFNSELFPPSLTLLTWLLGQCGWAGAVQELWTTPAAQSCALTISLLLAPQAPRCLLGEKGKLTFPAPDGPCKPWLCLSQIFPDVCHDTKHPWLLHHFGFSPSCAPIKPVVRLAAKIRWMGVCSLWDVWNFRGRVFLVRQRCFRAFGGIWGGESPRFQLSRIP